jgi:hypothetical protein
MISSSRGAFLFPQQRRRTIAIQHLMPSPSTEGKRREAAGCSLVAAGEMISNAACILPNWYSSKEGLTGESPAVFGGAGTALCQAGEGLQASIQDCVGDLFLASCCLDPIGLGDTMERVAEALQEKDFTEAALALEQSADEFEDYGKALDAEEHQSDHDRETAGILLQSAAVAFRSVADAWRRIP